MTHTAHRSRRPALVAAVLLAGALCVGLTACSSGSDDPTVDDVSAGVGPTWGSCMRKAGFAVEDPTDQQAASGVSQAPPGSDEEEFTRAGATCARKAGVEGSSAADQQNWERQYAKVASCIREDGFPDLPEQKPGVLDFASYERASEPAFQQAVEHCIQQFAPDTTTQNAG
jgi:hypothetical protein